MDFVQFCRLHGLLIDYLPPMGVWKRFPTEDHPKKRNGAVKYMGTHGFVQNHAQETSVSIWRSDDPQLDVMKIRRDQNLAHRRMIADQQKAADKARWIMSQCVQQSHEYLVRKGFKDEYGLVWPRPDDPLLVIPMRVDGEVTGCQLISNDGTKKFLKGQRTSGASFVLDNRGPVILCEGYATALSVQAAMRQLKRPYTIHVCFSAGNIATLARRMIAGVVVADNDASGTGEAAAQSTGWPYWMSDTVGEDANDYANRAGLFRFSQSLGKVIRSDRSAVRSETHSECTR
jgi:putative DNA primase/helicase